MASNKPILTHAAPQLSISSVEYREVVGFPWYRVGTDGSVWSRYRRGKSSNTSETWKKIKTTKRCDGYCYVNLSPGRNRFYVHALILITFVGERPPNMDVLYGDGQPTNNRLDNLRYGTRAENCADTKRHGRGNAGEQHYGSKLRALDAAAARTMYARHLGQWSVVKFLARWFNVSSATIYDVVNGKTWR